MLIKKIILLFFLSVFWTHSFSQQPFDFEGQYVRARYLTSKFPDSSDIVLNNIIEAAQKDNQPEYLAKAYYLKSFNSYVRSDADNAIRYAGIVLEISEKNHYAVGKALSYRMYGTQYAKLGLLEQAEESLSKGIAEIEHLNTDEGHELRGMIYNSYLILLNEKEYKRKLYYSEKSISEYLQIRNLARRNELLVSAYSNMGYNLSEVNKFKASMLYLKKALGLVGSGNNYLRCHILHDIGFAFSKNKQPDSAIHYYRKALDLANTYGFNEKKIEITGNLEEAYADKAEPDSAKTYKFQHLNLKDGFSYNKSIAVGKVLASEKKEYSQKLNQSRLISNSLMVACILLICLLGIIIYRIRKQKKKNMQITADVYERGIIQVPYEKDTDEIAETNESTGPPEIKMSPEVEENILRGLQAFEENLEFNSRNVAKYYLANNLNVNSKYLSAVIKKHKKANFNQYINSLRIGYIVDQLKNDPQYRKYKINHLAEISGYSSHSAFSHEFKKIVGIHPSAFIKNLTLVS
ncbi:MULTISPECIES: helix-turn-helix domain-containing protein [Chryseobacterium]|uniref:AraC-like DNA-binding protein n=1 Tax=Chryseobacterium camelliae TaxID=1265445 RepID=A0ABU0TN06_9FLAO|nr:MULTISPECIES: AraC family transcriptional regulator [Chryseobacterium]MDT3407725.1 AraC-like DNA-binding protein [Pseudacidovorax intermedius]MDQ1098423.1 AraC-like DNA-binding protein [Chryseobacterium camelliae]MDQ1102347.1 AraC-like DNA-binding protein [Chryseobacterium sp. SORGH_AS_1048]MDR6085784.1 AraC-like DNA-binding protein [Chryseobacterium sp. SORGH_AS_0909]MDR6130147.1 AraC-like DNA-binding protein [Chryseobacterium sp. SORGH_AS_1175]